MTSSDLDRHQPRPRSWPVPFVLSALVKVHVMSFFSHQPSPVTHKYCILSSQLERGILKLRSEEKLGRVVLQCWKNLLKKVCQSWENKQSRFYANKLIGSAVVTTNPPGDTDTELLCPWCPDLTIHPERPSRVFQGPIWRSNQFNKLNSSGGGDLNFSAPLVCFGRLNNRSLQRISNLHMVKCLY